MRRHPPDNEKMKVCRAYDHLRRRWQDLVDGSSAATDAQPLDENAAVSAQQKMVEHRASCELCQREDLALKKGEVPTPASAEVS